MEVDTAYAACLRYARTHYENFPVASMLVPSAARSHLAAVYAFARAADDFADEPGLEDGQRLTLLRSWRHRLELAAQSPAAATMVPREPGEPEDVAAIFLALGTTIQRLNLPVSCFEDLLSAFEQDVSVARYDSWDDLLDYCRRSANPVGRLVLRIAGQATSDRDAWSDHICTALQLTNFWQDFRQDFDRGRLYVPRDLLRSHGAREEHLQAGEPTASTAPPWRSTIEEVVVRTRELFGRGWPLCSSLRGRFRLEIRATWFGGMRILDRIERTGFDVFRTRPRLGPLDAAWIALRLPG